MITAVPVDTPVTMPVELPILATAGLLLDHTPPMQPVPDDVESYINAVAPTHTTPGP